MNVDIKKKQSCRLCNEESRFIFRIFVLEKYDVGCYKCTNCNSLQTEFPYWLNEAYSGNNLSRLDTGAAQRNIQNLAACYVVCKLFNAINVLDFGGGDGLLCRLLRDYNINCFAQDKFAQPTYSQGFSVPNFERPHLILGFEVIEHFSNPAEELKPFFNLGPNVVLLSTVTFNDNKKDWWYLSPKSGQHVFFYSESALKWIAVKYKYSMIRVGDFILFLRDPSPIKIWIARILLKNNFLTLVKCWLLTRPAIGVGKDYEIQINRINKSKS